MKGWGSKIINILLIKLSFIFFKDLEHRVLIDKKLYLQIFTAAKSNWIQYSDKNNIAKYCIFNKCFKIIHKNEERRLVKSRIEGTIDEYVCLHRWN